MTTEADTAHSEEIATPTPSALAAENGASPTPSAFGNLGLNEQLVSVVDQLGFKVPTPIQKQAIPAVLTGRDVVGLAQTGTGKTAAFVLPIVSRLLEQPAGSLRALIVVPTRELAAQVLDAVRSFSRGTGLRAISVYGGVRIQNQKNDLRRPLDIIVGCPGRLLDLLNQRSFSLDKVQFLVLDEADQMFDMGFIDPIRKLLRALPNKRQSLLFSATMPEAISTLTREALTDPVKVQVAEASSPSTLNHIAYPVVAHLKSQLLTHLLKEFNSESVLVFTRTKHKAKKLARVLEKSGIKATSLQGNLSQSQRMEAMKGFRSGKYSVMVATDIAARGIDVASISHVVNFDFPLTTETYVHRVGRTGRALRSGDALSFITRDDESQMRRVERFLKLKVVTKHSEGFDYNAKPDVNEMADDRGDRDDRQRSSRHRSTHTSHSPASSSYRGSRGSSSRAYSEDRGERGTFVPPPASVDGATGNADRRHASADAGSRGGYVDRRGANSDSRGGDRGSSSTRRPSSGGYGRYSDQRSGSSDQRGGGDRGGYSRPTGDSSNRSADQRGGYAPRSGERSGGYAPRSSERSGGYTPRSGERSGGYAPRGERNGNSSTGGYAPRSNDRGAQGDRGGYQGERNGNVAGGNSRGPSNYRGNGGTSSRTNSGGGRYGNSSSNSSSNSPRPQRSSFRSDRSRPSSDNAGRSRDR